MKFRDLISWALPSAGGEKTEPKRETGAVREAAGVTIDAGEDGFRKIGGNRGSRDLDPLSHSRMQELAVFLWKTNVLAKSLVELPVAYLLADGVSLSVRNEEAQEWLDAFWRDPINRMDIKLPKKLREMAIFGEQCWPTFVNEANGHVRLGYLDPAQIATRVTDPDNIEQVIGIVTRKDAKGQARRYRTIVNGPESVFSKRTQEIRQTFEDGECFYFKINDLSNTTHGHSDFMGQFAWLEGYDRALFGELERWDFHRAYIWDVTLKGATPEQVDERARKIHTPAPGSVRVHNESEEWAAVTPDLKASDSDGFARLFRNHIMGGATIPEHWYGGGGDVNRATAGEMGEPTFKMLSMRQRQWKHILEDVAAYVIRQRTFMVLGVEPADYFSDPGECECEAVFPEMVVRDTTKYAAALQQVTFAVIQGVD
ncbi:MAG: hypothetical protein ACLFWF_10530, partial [Alphaproteobacteria bacterium]